MLPLRLLRRRVLAACAGSALFNGVVLSSALTFLSVFVGVVLYHGGSDTANQVRNMIYFFAVPMVLGAAVSAQLLGRFSYRTLVAGGLALGAISGAFLIGFTATTPLWVIRYGFVLSGGLVVPLIPMGFGIGLALAGTVVAAQNEAPLEEVGAAVGLVRFFQSLGGAIGLSLLTAYQTWRFATLSAGAQSPSDVLDALVTSYNNVFLALVLVLVAALGFALFLRGGISRRAETDRRSAPVSGLDPVGVRDPPSQDPGRAGEEPGPQVVEPRIITPR